ncbi:lamin Dm0-like [Daphnia pulex]|uniref:lamin Dm0-like n=1 Tax=Daphnia pulex TaxID=6669 RepID=UPI001EDFEC48|nr:lamin Dm0-like [Daphnia pulex]
MSTRSERTPESSSQASSSASQSRSSPLSPTRLTRLQEKVELQNLNDRLANYIDRVRQLESENNRLTLQITTTQDSREVTSVRGLYEKELSDTRRLIDKTANEKARFQLEARRATAELGELTPKFNKAINERDKLAKQVSELHLALESELLARADLENRNMTLKEELSFKQQMYEREMTEVRSNKQVEISEIDGRLQEQNQARLQSTLQELRDQYESQIQQSRDEVEVLYQNKVEDLEDQVKKQRGAAGAHYEELIQARNRLKDANLKLSDMELANSHMKDRIAEMERNMETERQTHATAMQDASANSSMCQGEITRLREQMAIQLQEYQDLMDIRTALDMEISAYRKLLEGEETRLKLTPTAGASTSQSTRSGTPSCRTPTSKRTMLEESSTFTLADFIISSSAKGEVQIEEVDSEGKFIRLVNKSEKEVSLGGWQLVHKAQDLETIYKFHRLLEVAPGGTVSVWSADSGTAHKPPSTLVMMGLQWFVAREMVTQLLDNSGKEMAQWESKPAHTQGDPPGEALCVVL